MAMAVDDQCKLKFLDLMTKKAYRFIIYKIDENLKKIFVEKLGEPTLGYEDFASCFPENQCRYAIYVHDFVTADNSQKRKIFFIGWFPDTAGLRSKMLYVSSKDGFKSGFVGIQVDLQATNPAEMGLDVIKAHAY